MTILYIGSQGDDGRAAAAALRDTASGVGVVWVSHFDQAAHWLREHRDIAALVVEAWVDGQSCTSFLKHVRGAGLTAPVVIIAPEAAAPRREPLKARGYDFVARNRSLVRNLPVAASQAIERAQTRRRLSDMEASLRQHQRSWAIERTAAAEQRETLQALVDDERTKSAELEQKLAHAAAALQDAERRRLSAIQSAAEQLAERQAKYETSVARAAAARQMVEEELREAAILVARARQSHASAAAEVDRLGLREAELAAQVAAAHRDLELRLSGKAATLERELADARSAAEAAEQRFRDETAAASALSHEQAARLEDQMARERQAHESRLADGREEYRLLALERDSLAHALEGIREESKQLASEHARALHDHEDVSRNLQQTLERVSSEHASALAELAASVADRDAQIEKQVARHSASLAAAARERTNLEATFRTELADRTRAIAELEGRVQTMTQGLGATRSRCDTLQAEAELVPQLQAQLEERGAETRRQFEHSPMALCRCTRGGSLIRANQAFAALVGYRRPDQVHNADFAATIFESPDDLSWLIERCVSTRARESIETVWKSRKGKRVVEESPHGPAPDRGLADQTRDRACAGSHAIPGWVNDARAPCLPRRALRGLTSRRGSDKSRARC
jgi:hypothetical protein